MENLKKIQLYTDGACSGKSHTGGWGVVLIYNNYVKCYSGVMPNSTNNIMEITAVIKGLEQLKYPCEVTIFSDSAYVVNTFEKDWINNWQRNGWKTANKKDVKNVDLWKKLYELLLIHKFNFKKVKGHKNDLYNNKCDSLATSEVKKYDSQTNVK